MKDTVKSSIVVDPKIRTLVDKLTISYAYGESPDAEEDYSRLQLFKYSVVEGEFGPGGKVWKATKGPFTTISQPLPSGCGFVVKFGYSVHRHRAWITVNPSKFTAHDMDTFQGYLALLFANGSSSLWKHGKVQRMDFAIDIESAHFDDYAFVDRRLRRGSAIYQSQGTSYLGARHGARAMACYNKSKEILEKTGEVVDPRLRIEARLRPGSKVCEFGTLPNPFQSLMVIDRKILMSGTANVPVYANLIEEGMPADLAYWSCPPKARPQLWAQLQFTRPVWWDAEAIWKQAFVESSVGIF